MCNSGWDHTDASVVCRQLGWGTSGRSLNSRYFEGGSGFIFLSNVMCTTSNQNLAGCCHYGVGITYNCDHNSDAGVICNYDGIHEDLLLSCKT